MGAASSIMDMFGPTPVDDPSLGNHDRPYFEYFGMHKFDVALLLQLFNKMSKNREGKVNVKTILKRFGIRRSPFMEKIYSALTMQSLKNKASIDHKIFIYLTWNFLSIGLDLPALVMSLYDIERTKKLSREDVFDIMKDIHGWRLEQHHTDLVKAVRNIEATGLKLPEFQVFVLKNKLALEPIQNIFTKMQTKTLGKSRWTALALKRQQRWEGQFVDIYDILADMKTETGCPDHIISLLQFKSQIAKNLQYLADLEEKKQEKMKKNNKETEENDDKN